jgi:nucleoside deoxyribosyltransferase
LQDALAWGEHLKALCARHGFEGLYPLDKAAPRAVRPDTAQWIYEANVALIRRADIVMANLDFRGPGEPDSGTAFEVGFAVALQKPVWGYAADARADRARARPPTTMARRAMRAAMWSRISACRST